MRNETDEHYWERQLSEQRAHPEAEFEIRKDNRGTDAEWSREARMA